MEHIVIIGNGIAGVTAARHLRKLSDKRITIISAWFWKKNRIELMQAYVTTVKHDDKKVVLKDGSEVTYDKLIIATGSKPNKFGWPGQDLDGVQGLYSKQDLEQLEANAPNKEICKRAVIVGGGLIGIEMAEMLRSRKIPVTFLVREDSFWNGVLPAGESAMINEHIQEHHIDLRLGVNLGEILADENGRARAVVIKETGEEIACNVVGLTAGVSPNVAFLKESGIEIGRGVKVNRFLETNISDIYAIGDCAEQHEGIGQRRPIEAVWYTGRMMGETVAQTICGNKIEYKPGHWFNSAKFLDLEYQTYGWVFSEKSKKESEQHFHWRDAKEKICVTVAFDKETKLFLGINTFGIRMRHEIFNRWLTEKRDINYVMEFLKDANFDPEFYATYEAKIVAKFNSDFGTSISPQKKSWKRIFSNA